MEAPLASEAAGFDEVWLAEHHFIPPGVCPQAATLAGHLLLFPEGAGSREATLETLAGLADAVSLMARSSAIR